MTKFTPALSRLMLLLSQMIDLFKPQNVARNLRQRDKLIGSILALLTGIGVAYAAIGFRTLIYLSQEVLLGNHNENILSHVDNLPAWKIILSTVTGGLVVSFIYRYLMRSAQPGSIADVMAANAVHHTVIPTRKGLFSALASAIALGSGSAAGREGPVVHLGATVSSWVAQRLHLSPNMSRTLLGCGVAAAVSASFNAPIAGVFFALEVILGHYALSAFAPIVIASVSAAIVARIHIGNFPGFIIPDYYITTFWEFPAFILLGLISALAAIIFIKSLFFTEEFARKLSLPEWALPPFGGLAIGLLALISPYILGHGYGTTDGALKEIFSIQTLLLLIVLKVAASAIALAFRYGAGIFSPSLFLGAMVGGAFGFVAAAAAAQFGGVEFSYGLYAIVGMGAVSSAVLGAPISTILIIFELTGDYQITIALMVSVVISNLVTQHYLRATSVFHMQLKRIGLDLEGGRARHVMRSTHVHSLMQNDYAIASDMASIKDVQHVLLTKDHDHIYIIDEGCNLKGSVTLAELRKCPENTEENKEESPDAPLTAADICRPVTATLTPSDNLEDAFQKFDQSGEEALPVVTDDEQAEIVGILYHKQVLKAYNQALLSEKE
ncbi:chloride channel protein [Paremcibacter congregatus]|uniref:chloride channel protein n=1 Tax=Paremcibacter congregatus TaxID=2043170 RepID=UPI003A8FF258